MKGKCRFDLVWQSMDCENYLNLGTQDTRILSVLQLPFYWQSYQFLTAYLKSAPVAQLDRAPGFEPGGSGFESLRVRQAD